MIPCPLAETRNDPNWGMVQRPVLRYHGAKFRLAPWIISCFPEHRIYVEPFGGAAGVLVQKPRSYAEIYNDLDDDVANFFRVLRDPDTRKQLTELLILTPFARVEFEAAFQPATDPVERARRLVIRAMMGFGSAGATKNTTGFRIDTKREYETAQHLWAMYPANIAAVGQRLSGVLIENRPALDVIQAHDTPATLHYIDPPYLPTLRDRRNASSAYRHEMSVDDHLRMLEVLRNVTGMVVLSGYPSDLYDDNLRGWEKRTTGARIAAGRGTALRKEVLWINPACVDALHQNLPRQPRLFQEANKCI